MREQQDEPVPDLGGQERRASADHPADERAVSLHEARLRLYRPAATDLDVRRYLARRPGPGRRIDVPAAAEDEERAEERAEGEERGRDRPDVLPSDAARATPSRRWTKPLVVVAALAAAVAFGGGLLLGVLAAAPPATPSRSAEPLVAALARQQADARSPGRAPVVIAASDALDGSVPIQVFGLTPSSRIELVVRCPAPDRSFRASVTPVGRLSGTAVFTGRCGSVVRRDLPGSSGGALQVLVRTEGDQPSSAALLRR